MNHHITVSSVLLAPADAVYAADNNCPKQPSLLNLLLSAPTLNLHAGNRTLQEHHDGKKCR